MANENMRVSAEGLAALRQREAAVFQYYNDAANNCTYGVGSLAHHGQCTESELRRPVSIADVNRQLAIRVNGAAATVRRRVRHTTLTQEQFDALVSFTFNTGATGARAALDAADRAVPAEVVRHINNNVYVHLRDANGRRLTPIRLQGLANRRRQEAAPFRVPRLGTPDTPHGARR